MTTNTAEVPKFAARPTPYDSDERTWLEFLFKLENYLTLVNEKYVALVQDAESQPVANVPAGTDESSVLIRPLSDTLYALLATDHRTKWYSECRTETGSKSGDSWWRKTHRRQRVQAVLQLGMGDNPAKFEETWNAWEHQVDVYEKLTTSKLDDDVKINVVLREAPTKLRDNLLVDSQQFESNYNKLRAIIQAYQNSNKSWTANDFRSDTKE